MNNKFDRKDFSKFDPTNASAEDVRKWLFAIIDAELEKAPEERDYDLIAECSEFEAELFESEIELPESVHAADLERIKARMPATEHKEVKILEPKKKTKKSGRRIAILAASLATLILSLSVAAAVQGKPVVQFISDNIKIILGMDTGDKLEEDGITLVKNGELINYSSIEEAIGAIDSNMLYPTYLPVGVKVDRVIIANSKEVPQMSIVYVTNDKNLSIMIAPKDDAIVEDLENSTAYEGAIINFYIWEFDGIYQAVGIHNNMKYNIKYNNYDELIKILNVIKEIEK